VAVAIGAEAMQRLVPGRTPCVSDVLLNVAGLAIGTLLMYRRTRSRIG
jgi:VanZ family protein